MKKHNRVKIKSCWCKCQKGCTESDEFAVLFIKPETTCSRIIDARLLRGWRRRGADSGSVFYSFCSKCVGDHIWLSENFWCGVGLWQNRPSTGGSVPHVMRGGRSSRGWGAARGASGERGVRTLVSRVDSDEVLQYGNNFYPDRLCLSQESNSLRER